MPYTRLGRLTHKAMQFGVILKNENAVMDVPGKLVTASDVMLCAARKAEYIGAALDFARRLKEILPSAGVLIVTHTEIGDKVDTADGDDRIVIPRDEINWLGLPGRQSLQPLLARDCDLAIDLSIDFDLVNTQICRKSRAPIRACLYHPQRDPFFNLQVRTSDAMTVEEKYLSVLRCLKTLLPQPQARAASEPVAM